MDWDLLVQSAKEIAGRHGAITLDQVDVLLPAGEVTTGQVEQIYARLREVGIEIVETKDV